MKSTNFSYIPALDHLRGFAALLVLFFHGVHFISHKILYDAPYDPSNWPKAGNPVSALLIEGHTAVSLFFVLSGFVFTVGAFHRRIYFWGFYKNRFLRTYPLFLFLLGLGVLFNLDNVAVLPLLKSVFFLANSPTAFNGGPYTYVFWSIAVEWHFYLLFPLLFLLVEKFNWPILLLLIASLIGIRTLAFYQEMDMRLLSYWSIFGRLDQFLMGMLAGIVYNKRFKAGRTFDVLAVVGLLLTLVLVFGFNGMGGGALNNGVWILWPTLESAAWAAFVLGYISISRHIPDAIARVLLAGGTVSYSIYLLHYVVLDFFMVRNWDVFIQLTNPLAMATANVLLVVMPVVLIVSTITYSSIEKPFLKLRSSYMNRA